MHSASFTSKMTARAFDVATIDSGMGLNNLAT